MTIKKILIANRGEIACRIIRTVRSLGLTSVAVYSDADKNALHVTDADHAVHIGPSEVAKSYLDIDRIIQASLESGADAIHPGYGFLSENADFARACESAGISFIGPSADAINVMGDKARAKQLMIKAGVPCVPGYQGEKQDDTSFKENAEKIGFPLLIKAAAGGGGRGMRLVKDIDQLTAAIKLARSEAQSAFRSDSLILEKAITSSRHVEFQVFADAFGNTIHLGERDCSAQRRYQKVIEEAPCPAMTHELREKMGNAAVSAARAVNYVGAGTVEFLLDNEDNFYFLEMNTRLQVEHPVTEEITGLDLVALQIAIANDKPLPLTQKDVQIDGHAIEARLYAEDPGNDFLPATGKVLFWKTLDNSNIRVDTGINTGAEISPYYDPMIAKIVATGSDRAEALQRLITGLNDTAICGIKTNREFLISLLEHKIFNAGETTTSFISENFSEVLGDAENLAKEIIAAASLIEFLIRHRVNRKQAITVSNDLLGWTSTINLTSFIDFQVEGKAYSCEIIVRNTLTHFEVKLNGEAFEIELLQSSDNELKVKVGKDTIKLFYSDSRSSLFVSGKKQSFELIKCDTLSSSNKAANSGGLVIAPMHGKLITLFVAIGDRVEKGDRVAILEAMKMQHELIAEVNGIVKSVFGEPNAQIALNDLILEIQPEKEQE